MIKEDLNSIEKTLRLSKGKHIDEKKGYGANHITARHSNPKDLGYVSQNELLNLGNSVREYIKEHKEPFIDKNGIRIYEWQDKQGIRFRLVVGQRKEVSSKELGFTYPPSYYPKPSTSGRIITFYSDRNLKQRMEFKNPKLKSPIDKLKDKFVKGA
ncbi:hypothetical protein BJI48_04550 [Helicobacter sp. 11S02596-1]|nr:hypothetical protein BJI48_04550 [Helicobacter sp. 11S02596-1]